MKMLDEMILKWHGLDISQTKPLDFDLFWDDTISRVKAKKLNLKVWSVESPYSSSEKQIVCYPFAKHEGGGSKHSSLQLLFLKKHFFKA
ncbi:MAG: hypothetical protein JW808_02015 [Victivallales bacterium]|nr:hypothetical protein [Victivallales bacterium]